MLFCSKVCTFTLTFFVFIHTVVLDTIPCDLIEQEYGMVCRCTAQYCDYLDVANPENTQDFTVVSSSSNGLRFSVENGTFGDTQTYTIEDANLSALDQLLSLISLDTVNVVVNRTKTYQKIVGFGGALTGAVSIHLQKLSSDLQDHMYKSFFHDSGIKFNMIRTSIGGCDFDLEPWAYNEQPIDDTSLSNFTKLDDRDLMKVQQMQRIKDVANLKDLKIMATVWSPPKWMKSNNDWTGVSSLKEDYYQTFANYYLKYLELMALNNMPIWAISTGNEPENGNLFFLFVSFMSLGWTAETQAKWLGGYLGPTIRNSTYKDVLIFSNDDQRSSFPDWFVTMNSTDSNCLSYVDGIAVHWYLDILFSASLLDDTHEKMPDKVIMNTESCYNEEPKLGQWSRAARYASAMIEDFTHSVQGWIDWNLCLNETGGPNYDNNQCDAPVIVNTTDYTEFYKQPIFYALGHFSKFLPPASIRVSVESSDSSVETVGYQRPDGSIAVILHNTAIVGKQIVLSDSQRGNATINIPAGSIHTIVCN